MLESTESYKQDQDTLLARIWELAQKIKDIESIETKSDIALQLYIIADGYIESKVNVLSGLAEVEESPIDLCLSQLDALDEDINEYKRPPKKRIYTIN